MNLILGPTYRRNIIDSLEHFYDKYECVGYTLTAEDGTTRNFLLTREPI